MINKDSRLNGVNEQKKMNYCRSRVLPFVGPIDALSTPPLHLILRVRLVPSCLKFRRSAPSMSYHNMRKTLDHYATTPEELTPPARPAARDTDNVDHLPPLRQVRS
jgi:hypothetical protein